MKNLQHCGGCIKKLKTSIMSYCIRRKVLLCSLYANWPFSCNGDSLQNTQINYFYHFVHNSRVFLLSTEQRGYQFSFTHQCFSVYLSPLENHNREGENETHGFNGEFHEKNGSSSWSGDEKSWQNTFVLLWSSAPIVKISNPKEISFEFIHFCPLVRSDEIALLHASLNNISLQSFLFSLL